MLASVEPRGPVSEEHSHSASEGFQKWLAELRLVAPLCVSFGCALGCYWMLRGMKNALFMELVGPEQLPAAKIASIAFLLVLLVIYGKLVDWLGKRRLLAVLYFVYACLFAALTYAFDRAGRHPSLGWGFYLAIESFGSLGVSHLWSLAVNSTRDPDPATRRFPILAVGGQIGAVLCTFLVSQTAHVFGLVPLLLLSVGLLALAPVMALWWLGKNHIPDAVEVEPDEAGLMEGLHLVATRPYLLSILFSVMSYEFIGTFIDYRMNFLAAHTLVTLEKVTWFLAIYGTCANLLSLTFALTGTSFLVRRLGLSRCLVYYPTALAIVVLVAAAYPTLWVLFAAQIALKGLAYGFNKPCLEMLYVPTSDSIQFKAKSWIDTAGSRCGKAIGSVMNGSLPALFLVSGGTCISLGIILLWRPVARRLGGRHAEMLQRGEKLH